MRSIRVEERGQKAWGAAATLEPRFAPMIERLERLAADRPHRHGYRVMAAGMLGYVVLAGVLCLSVVLFAGVVVVLVTHPAVAAAGIKLLLPIGGIALSLILALRVNWPEADGIVVLRQDAPTLHELVESIRKATGGPRIHDVRITGVMNAAITQYPRLLFLPSRNILFLGLPLLQASEPREIEAVIAHEMGHFVGRHGRTASFVYHIRTRWTQLGERLPTGVVAGVLRRFFAWYGPWFAAYSFVLARRQEYEADERAAAVVGSQTMADALVRIACQSARWHAGWSLIWEQSVERPDPPASPYRLLGAAAAGEANDAAAETLALALACHADLDDTHPSLAQRLSALGVAPRLPPPIGTPAADVLLGSAIANVIDRLDAEWHAATNDAWSDDYQGRQALLAERAKLDERAELLELDWNAHHRLAQLVEVLDGPRRGAEAYAAVLARFPEAHDSRFRHGDALLDIGDDAGIESLLEAANGEPALRQAALDRIVGHAYAAGRPDLIEVFEPQLDAAVATNEETRRLSSMIDDRVTLRPLGTDKYNELVALAATVAGVKWLLAGSRDLPAGPQLVFVFATQGKCTGTEVLDALCEAMLPAGDLLGIQNCRPRRWLTKRLRQLPNSCIRG